MTHLVTPKKWIRACATVGLVGGLSSAVGCDSNGSDGPISSGGATGMSGGASNAGGHKSGGASNGGGASGGAASAGAGGLSSGGAPGGGTSGAPGGGVGGQGGEAMNHPMCPAEKPTHEGDCFVTPIAVCSYEGTNCVCSSGEWDCVGCPPEFVLGLNGEDCSGYEGEACKTCQCPTGPEPKWSCLEQQFGTQACASGRFIHVTRSREDDCLIASLWKDGAECIGEATGDGYCVRIVQRFPGRSCDEPEGDLPPFWRASDVTGTIQVEGDAETPLVSLDLVIEYDPESGPGGEPPPNDALKFDSCAADCSSFCE